MSEAGVFTASDHYRHGQGEALGVLLVALGSPHAPTAAALRRYLRQFLGDRRVIEMRPIAKWLLLNLVILPRRSPASAANYRKIWKKQGAPLLVISGSQQKKLQKELRRDSPFVSVRLAMSYGEPTIPQALEKLRHDGMTKLLVLPLYPQYASATVASVFEAITAELRRWRWIPDARFIHSYHDHPGLINILADSVRAFRKKTGRSQLLLFSFHGIPLISLKQGDPYHCHCCKTARLVAEKLKLAKNDYMVSFQSRLGKQPWLQPYTDETLASLPAKGIKDVQVICPGFSADCLETIEEIDEENRALFMQAGGKRFGYIPCLNDSVPHISLLAEMVKEAGSDWMRRLREVNASSQKLLSKKEYQKRKNADATYDS